CALVTAGAITPTERAPAGRRRADYLPVAGAGAMGGLRFRRLIFRQSANHWAADAAPQEQQPASRRRARRCEMTSWLSSIARWCDHRLQLRETLGPMLRHPIPREVAGPVGWWYVFGSASLTLLLLQILTGIGLALVYVPAADKAYDSL